ncbi:MAG TPA: hypothetical protein VMG10_00635 [Gemmataceae bacterium]|nr:hypothetical protein [Gemmataceae bacterium]
MILCFSKVLRNVCCGGLLLASLGCSRSAVVMVPEEPSRADEAVAKETLARGQADEAPGSSFSFPDDAGGVLLAKVLPPKPSETLLTKRTEPPRQSALSASMKPPALPLPPGQAILPRLPDVRQHAPLRPSLLLEESLDGLSAPLVLPEKLSLPVGARVHVHSIDVNEPIPLPTLSRPVTERASLEDPTRKASIAAALAAPIPSRSSKAPFLKLTLPDPYDRRRGEAPSPEESKEFPLGSPQLPRRWRIASP